jgi:hypothetical protein
VRRLVWLILNFINATGIKDASMLLEVRSKEHSFRAKTSRWTSFENDQAALKLIYTLQVTIIKKNQACQIFYIPMTGLEENQVSRLNYPLSLANGPVTKWIYENQDKYCRN